MPFLKSPLLSFLLIPICYRLGANPSLDVLVIFGSKPHFCYLKQRMMTTLNTPGVEASAGSRIIYTVACTPPYYLH